jgi:hypothetical protein
MVHTQTLIDSTGAKTPLLLLEQRLRCLNTAQSHSFTRFFLKLPRLDVVLMANTTCNIAATGAMTLRQADDQQQI